MATFGDVGRRTRRRGDGMALPLGTAGEVRRPLVPDVAFLSRDRRGGRDVEALEAPDIAPDIVVEVLSPDDRRDRVAEKRRVYLACGTILLLEVDPFARRIDAWDDEGRHEAATVGLFQPTPYPDLAISLQALFADLDL